MSKEILREYLQMLEEKASKKVQGERKKIMQALAASKGPDITKRAGTFAGSPTIRSGRATVPSSAIPLSSLQAGPSDPDRPLTPKQLLEAAKARWGPGSRICDLHCPLSRHQELEKSEPYHFGRAEQSEMLERLLLICYYTVNHPVDKETSRRGGKAAGRKSNREVVEHMKKSPGSLEYPCFFTLLMMLILFPPKRETLSVELLSRGMSSSS
jgi:hypothetical protein